MKRVKKLLQKIFSVKNVENRKVFNILGVKIKVERNQKTQIYKSINELKNLQEKQFQQLKAMMLLTSFSGLTIEEASLEMYKKYPKASGFLANVQACNLKLMKILKNLCDELGIKFWLHAGTLIGQLRHKGFIPWDDDVDLAMTRADFNVLKKSLEVNDKLQLCEYYNEVTCSRQYQLKFKKSDIPVFIDIAVYDECGAVTPEQIVQFRELFGKVKAEMLDKFHFELNSPKIIDIGYYKVGLLDEKNKKAVDKLIDSQSAKLVSGEKLNNPSYFYALQNYPFPYPVMLNRDLYPLQLVEFEDTAFYIPFNSIEYLKEGYGDIFVPPVDIGVNRHVYAFMNKKDSILDFIASGEVHE